MGLLPIGGTQSVTDCGGGLYIPAEPGSSGQTATQVDQEIVDRI
jgi:hypothetical protein